MYQTLHVQYQSQSCLVTLNCPKNYNKVTPELIYELHAVLDEIESKANNRLLILQGKSGIFCAGMDLEVASKDSAKIASGAYMHLLRRFATIPRVIVAKVVGTVIAGGVGLVAASDLVIATPESQFSLSEALWGLLPCCVAPYLIRRIGFQAAYRLALTTSPITAEEAYRIQLVDTLSVTPDEILKQFIARFSRLEVKTLAELKSYFRKLWIITEEMEAMAVAEITRLMQTTLVQHNLNQYANEKRFPWEKEEMCCD